MSPDRSALLGSCSDAAVRAVRTAATSVLPGRLSAMSTASRIRWSVSPSASTRVVGADRVDGDRHGGAGHSGGDRDAVLRAVRLHDPSLVTGHEVVGDQVREVPGVSGKGHVAAGERTGGGQSGARERGRFPVGSCEVQAVGWAGDREQPSGQFGQRFARDLARGRPRQCGHSPDLHRHLEVGEFPAAPREQLRAVDTVGAGHHHRDRDLAELLVRSSGDSGVAHPGHPGEHGLDLAGVHVLPAPDDHVVAPTGDPQVAGVIAAGEVAGAVPAVAKHLCGGLRLVVVTQHHVRAVDPDLADRTGRHLVAGVRVDHAQVQSGQRQTARTGHPLTARPHGGDRPAHFGAAVVVGELDTEGGLEPLGELGGGDRARDEKHTRSAGSVSSSAASVASTRLWYTVGTPTRKV